VARGRSGLSEGRTGGRRRVDLQTSCRERSTDFKVDFHGTRLSRRPCFDILYIFADRRGSSGGGEVVRRRRRRRKSLTSTRLDVTPHERLDLLLPILDLSLQLIDQLVVSMELERELVDDYQTQPKNETGKAEERKSVSSPRVLPLLLLRFDRGRDDSLL